MKVRNPERRLRVWASLCQVKRVCEHTGGPQPTYRLEHGTMKIMAEFPKPKADDDELAAEAVQERKIVSDQGAHGGLAACMATRAKTRVHGMTGVCGDFWRALHWLGAPLRHGPAFLPQRTPASCSSLCLWRCLKAPLPPPPRPTGDHP